MTKKAGKKKASTRAATRSSKAKRARAAAASKSSTAPRKTTPAPLTTVDAAPIPGDPAVPIRWRVFQRAAYALIEQGKSPTQATLAEQIGVSRQAVWAFFRRQPGFLPWLDAEMRAENDHLFGSLGRRMYHLGMQGSVAHAEMFAKLTTGHFLKGLSPFGGGDGGLAPVNNGVILNLLVPRPDQALQLTSGIPPALPVIPTTAKAIPTVGMR